MPGKLTKDISTTALMILRLVLTRINALSFSEKEKIISPYYFFCEFAFYRQHSISGFHVFIGNIVERTLN